MSSVKSGDRLATFRDFILLLAGTRGDRGGVPHNLFTRHTAHQSPYRETQCTGKGCKTTSPESESR